MLHGELLYANKLMAIHGYQCSGHDTPHDEDEAISWFDIVLPRRGVYVYKIEKRDMVASVNHACLIDPGLTYRVTHPTGEKDASTVVSLGRNMFRMLLTEFDIAASDLDTEQLRSPSNHITASPALSFQHYKLISLAENPSRDLLEVEETALALCGEVARLSFVHSNKKPRASRPKSIRFYEDRVKIVQLHLASHYTRTVSLAELAHYAALSPFHLSRIFTSIVGMPIHRYLTRLRLNHSLDRLLDARGNLTQIALDAGFSSHSHFTAAIRSEFSMTPSTMRAVLLGERLRKGN